METKSSSRERTCRIYFHFASEKGQEIPEEVRVVGDHPSVGSGDPAQGLVLVTNADIFPCWISTEPIFVSLHTKVTYKYVATMSDACWYYGEDSEYKDIEEAEVREFVASGPEMTIEDDNGLYRQFSAGGASHETAEALTTLARTPAMMGMDHKMNRDERLEYVQELEGEAFVSPRDTVYMFHFDLPIKVVRRAEGGYEATHSAFGIHWLPLLEKLKQQKTICVKCIGWPGIHVTKEKEKQEITDFLEEYDCIPVFPPQSEFEEFREFTDNFLWKVFHDVVDFAQSTNPPPFNEQGWASYQHINNIYANEVVKHAHANDMIWIHDYQLMMMPTFISRKLARANIGFHLHAPFPSSDTFKTLSIREELLSGMLCADQVGFQFFSSARNFVVSCKRIYGLDPTFRACGFMGLDYNGRTVAIRVAHFGLPYEDTIEIVNSEAVDRKTKEVKSLFEGKIIFVGQDRARSLSGLTAKFRDFRRFLTENPQYRGKVILVQYSLPIYDQEDGRHQPLFESLKLDADALIETCDQTGALKVRRTGSGDQCDVFLRCETYEREDCLALFKAADVYLDTSVKAGLNTIPFDFITAHHGDKQKHSQVIVSEFAGCSRVLLGSLRINPWNSQEVIMAIQKAVEMGEVERLERWEINHQYTSDYSPVVWFEDFIKDLRRARKKEGTRIEHIGFGAKIRPMAVTASFQRLNVEEVMRALFISKRRVFFLDNEGTLAADKRNLYRAYGAPTGDVTQLSSHGTAPNEQVLQYLRDLTADSRNTVVVLSGRTKEQMEDWFGSVPKIGLAAERGFYYKLPCVTGDQWQSAKIVDSSWKTHAYELMRQFCKRTQGAYIENKGSALVWQYRDADQHYGSWQAKELSSHLKELLFGSDVEVIGGKGFVEVKLRNINKGISAAKMLSKIAKTFGEPDFVLCCGDDRSDEDMFEVVNLFGENSERVKDNDTASQLSTTDETYDGTSEDMEPTFETKSRGLQRSSFSRPLSPTSPQEGEMGGMRPLSAMKKNKNNSFSPGTHSEPGMGGMCSNNNLFGMGSISGDLNNLGGMGSFDEDHIRRFYTCVVGRKPSAAKSFLHDVEEMSELLGALAAQNKRRNQMTDATQNLAQNAQTWSGTMSSEGPGMQRQGSSGDSRGGSGGMPGLGSVGFGSRGKRSFGSRPLGSMTELSSQG